MSQEYTPLSGDGGSAVRRRLETVTVTGLFGAKRLAQAPVEDRARSLEPV